MRHPRPTVPRRPLGATLATLTIMCAVGDGLVVARAQLGPGDPPGGTAPAAGPSVIEGTVTSIADGDTITVETGSGKTRVRLLGIDAPEVSHGDAAAQCGAEEARAALAALAPVGARVVVSTDPHCAQADRYGRALGYVAGAGSADVGLDLVRAGLAEAWIPDGEPERARWQAYAGAARTARDNRVGSWAECAAVGR